MKKINRLQREALESCKFRGHDMKKFQHRKNGRMDGGFAELSFSVCKKCGMEVHCDTHPAPNGIDISGEAVALHCE